MLTNEDKLILLIEECGEVIQAATKCLRFGYDRLEPGYGVNSEVLAQEVGDLEGVIASLDLDDGIVTAYRKLKMAKAERVKAEREQAMQQLATQAQELKMGYEPQNR